MTASLSSTYVDAEPVRGHVKTLLRTGLTIRQIALAAGIPESSVHYILNGRPKQNIPPAHRVAGKTARAVLSVREEHAIVSALSEAVNHLRNAADLARVVLDGDSNDDEHVALYELIEASENVILNWSTK